MQKSKAPSDISAFPGALAGAPLVSPGDGPCAGHPCARRESQSLQLPTHIWEEEEEEGGRRVLTNRVTQARTMSEAGQQKEAL